MNFSLSTNNIIIILILCLMFFKYYKIRKEKNIEEELIRRSQEDMMPVESLEKMNYPKKLEITNSSLFFIPSSVIFNLPNLSL